MRTKRLGDMFIEQGLITKEQLEEALKYQAMEKDRLGATLVKHNYITEKQLIDTLRLQLGKGKKSMAFKIDFIPEDKALDPKDIERFVKKILGNLKFRLGADIR